MKLFNLFYFFLFTFGFILPSKYHKEYFPLDTLDDLNTFAYYEYPANFCKLKFLINA